MEALLKENQLLKDYTKTLEKENDARNEEKVTLYREMDRLIAENQELSRNSSSNANPGKSESTTILNLQNQLEIHKQKNTTLTKEIENLNARIISIRGELSNKQNEIVRLTQEKQRYTQQISTLQSKQKTSIESSSSSYLQKISLLEGELRSYKLKASQVGTLQSKIQIFSQKLQQLENENTNLRSSSASGSDLQYQVRDLSNKINILQNQNRHLKSTNITEYQSQIKQFTNKITILESQNRNLKANQTLTAEFSNIVNQKMALEVANRQQAAKYDEIQGNYQILQKQNQLISSKARDLESQLFEKRNALLQLKKVEQSYHNISSNLTVKDKELQALEQMISSLKDNKRFIQKTLKDRDEMISKLESEIYFLKSNQLDRDHILEELNQLKNINSELGKSKNALNQRIIELTSENNTLMLRVNQTTQNQNQVYQLREKLIKESESNLNLINELKRENQILREKNTDFALRQSRAKSRVDFEDEDDLRAIVKRLKVQLDEVKNSNLRLENQNFKTISYLENHLEQPRYQSQINNINASHRCGCQCHANGSSTNSRTVASLQDKFSSRGALQVQNTKFVSSFRPEKPYSQIEQVRSAQKYSVNKSKWQNLQKKINNLRMQNDELKKSLFQ